MAAAEASMRLPAEWYRAVALLACLLAGISSRAAYAQTPAAAQVPQKPTVFHVKYVSDGSVYIDAGRNADIQEGMKLSVVEAPADGAASDGVRFRGDAHVAELNVVSVADSSAVCDIVKTNTELKVGQLAFLTSESVQDRRLAENAAQAQEYPIVVGFTYGDPLDEELRETKVQRPMESPLGTIRGRVGLDYGGIRESGMNSTQLGMMLESDMTHIGGTYWNFTGYWRGRLNTSTSGLSGANTTTITDLINRTYHLGFTYQNPYSPVTLGVGRLYLPWAPSLSTLDGGYFGRRIARIATVGAFAGSTPDPTSWSYNPNQHIAGTFVNLENGDFDHIHFISTAGIAVTSIHWRVARQFAFFENTFSWKRYVSFYNSLQADEARKSPLVNGGSNPTGVTQSFSTVHFQPTRLVGFGINHNYFRNLPTFDPSLVGTGLLDKYLFQGFSGDVRLSLPKHIELFAGLGRSKASTDKKNSLNQTYGLAFGEIWKTGLRADLRYSKFDSAFGSGGYQSITLSKNLSETLRLQVQGGRQTFNSSLSNNNHSNFMNATVDWTLGRRYFLSGNFSLYQGTSLNYQQWSAILGYRFGGYRH
jgi:hypothetical protein